MLFHIRSSFAKFADAHPVGFCKQPDNLVTRVAFAAPGKAVPLTVLNLAAATKTEDQGASPKCAAYSCSSFAENILWRRTGRIPSDIDPSSLYNRAKQLDGDPRGDGTTLTAVLQALLDQKIFAADRCAVRTILSTFDVKAAIHRYGACLLGLNISEEWYKGRTYITETSSKLVGGHAVLCTGYDSDGCWIQNSWGQNWGSQGFARIAWPAFNRQFMYGGILRGCLNDLD